MLRYFDRLFRQRKAVSTRQGKFKVSAATAAAATAVPLLQWQLHLADVHYWEGSGGAAPIHV